jgi:hypothetical protein
MLTLQKKLVNYECGEFELNIALINCRCTLKRLAFGHEMTANVNLTPAHFYDAKEDL